MWWLPHARGVSVAGTITLTKPTEFAARPLPNASISFELVTEQPPSPPRGAPRSSLGLDSQGDQAGGDGLATETTWLLDDNHPLTLQDSLRNANTESQVQRIDTAHDRASQENRRAALYPNDDLFLATGRGWVPQRATRAPLEPTAGDRRQAAASQPLGSAATSADGTRLAASSASLGAESLQATARGQRATRGHRQQRGAPVKTARPDVDLGPPATLATAVDRVRDNRNADLRAAQLMQAFVQSGSAGVEAGQGEGGQAVGATPGAGAQTRPGSHSQARGQGGDGEPGGERYIRWYTEQRARIGRALVFPRSRQLAMDQGTTLLRLWVGRDGGLLEPPRVMRSSGFGDLDDAALTAVLRSAPFTPLPDDIAPESQRIRLTVPIEFWNPTVH